MTAFPWILAATGWGLALFLLLAIKYGREDADRRLEDLAKRADAIEERIERLATFPKKEAPGGEPGAEEPSK